VAALGCASYRAPNARLERFEAGHGYRPSTIIRQHGAGDVLLILAFSGGGTRAAALAYGVLQELRDTAIETDGNAMRLLDEVDAISSVSGGSFTSAYYGLYGDRVFEDFEERFLRRNVQTRLIVELFRPVNWLRMARGFFSRTELAVDLYDRQIFDRKSFADLDAAEGPLIRINATDLSLGSYFSFVQGQFDPICSDLSEFKVARAVAASSAVPGLFAPITLINYAGECGYEEPQWLAAALESRKTEPRAFYAARNLQAYLDADAKKYVHLVDGGVSDNLGIRAPLDEIMMAGGFWERIRQAELDPPRHVLVIMVNAEPAKERSFDLSAAPPSLAAMLHSVSGVQMKRDNFETIALMRETMERWASNVPARADASPTEVTLIEIGFGFVEDPEERRYFQQIKTNFNLDDETIDRLIEVARRLLRESEEFQALVDDLAPADREQ